MRAVERLRPCLQEASWSGKRPHAVGQLSPRTTTEPVLPLLTPECGGGVTCSLRLVTPARRPATPARSFLGEARLGRALTPVSLAEPQEADPRETRAASPWEAWCRQDHVPLREGLGQQTFSRGRGPRVTLGTGAKG